MKRLLLVILVISAFLPGVAADSTVTGWLPLGSGVNYNSGGFTFKDVSLSGGSALLYIVGPGVSGTKVVPAPGMLEWSDQRFVLNSAIATGEVTYFNFTYTFPYLLSGHRLYIGDYGVFLKSVTEKSATVVVSRGNTSREFTVGSGSTVSFENLRLSLTPMPTLFSGYLRKGAAVSAGGIPVRFDGYNVTSISGTPTATVALNIAGKEYYEETGKTFSADGLILQIGGLLGSDYLKAAIKLDGAYVNASLLPSFKGWMGEGKTEKLGPYLIRIDAVSGSGAYVSIMNPCGRKLRSGFISTGTFAQGLYYGGLMLGAAGVKEENGVNLVDVIAFLDPNKVPKVGEMAFLNVSIEAPAHAVQYVPFDVNVTVKNTGSMDLGYLEVVLRISSAFKILNSYPHYLQVLPRGKELRFTLRLLPEKAGKLRLGDVEVVAHVPYELSCYGMEAVNFTSETRTVDVTGASFSYEVHVSAANGTVGKPIPVNVTVTNRGNVNATALLNVALPSGFWVSAENFTLYGKWLSREIVLAPNQTKVFPISVIPSAAGKYKITVGVESHGKTFYNSTSIAVAGTAVQPQPEENQTAVPANNTTCTPQVITKVVNVTQPCNATETVVEGGLSLKDKLLYIGGAFAAGAAFILLLAWLAARMEEEEGEEE